MNDPAKQRLRRLLSWSWKAFDRVKRYDFVIHPAIPILFFGDSERYFTSRLRVITVALNPSCQEFPKDGRFSRFPSMEKMTDSARRRPARHHAALNNYYCKRPYEWFSSFEPILRGMDASYYGCCRNTVLHTDLCSPIATSPTWSRLDEQERLLLEWEGIPLWHSLVKVLAPQVIIVSVAARNLEKIKFRRLAKARVIWRLDRERPYEVNGTPIEIEPSKQSLLVFGRAAQRPFGTVSNARKAEIGTAVKGVAS